MVNDRDNVISSTAPVLSPLRLRKERLRKADQEGRACVRNFHSDKDLHVGIIWRKELVASSVKQCRV